MPLDDLNKIIRKHIERRQNDYVNYSEPQGFDQPKKPY